MGVQHEIQSQGFKKGMTPTKLRGNPAEAKVKDEEKAPLVMLWWEFHLHYLLHLLEGEDTGIPAMVLSLSPDQIQSFISISGY